MELERRHRVFCYFLSLTVSSYCCSKRRGKFHALKLAALKAFYSN
jgi:hypothetical protein